MYTPYETIIESPRYINYGDDYKREYYSIIKVIPKPYLLTQKYFDHFTEIYRYVSLFIHSYTCIFSKPPINVNIYNAHKTNIRVL